MCDMYLRADVRAIKNARSHAKAALKGTKVSKKKKKPSSAK